MVSAAATRIATLKGAVRGIVNQWVHSRVGSDQTENVKLHGRDQTGTAAGKGVKILSKFRAPTTLTELSTLP